MIAFYGRLKPNTSFFGFSALWVNETFADEDKLSDAIVAGPGPESNEIKSRLRQEEGKTLRVLGKSSCGVRGACNESRIQFWTFQSLEF